MPHMLFPPQDKPGRPVEITEEKIEIVCDTISEGGTYLEAASRACMSYSGIRRWVNRGFEAAEKDEADLEDKDRLFMKFCEKVDRACAEYVMSHLRNIDEISKGGKLISRTTTKKPDGSEVVSERYSTGDWKASQYLLAIRDSDRFSMKSFSKVEKEVKNTNLNVDIASKLPESEAAKLAELLQQAMDGPDQRRLEDQSKD